MGVERPHAKTGILTQLKICQVLLPSFDARHILTGFQNPVKNMPGIPT